MPAIGFDTDKYLAEQTTSIIERGQRLGNKLHLEFGGKIAYDFHAARVLPGYDQNVEIHLLQGLRDQAEILVCIYAGDVARKKVRADFGIPYDVDSFKLIDDLREWGLLVRAVVITRFEDQPSARIFKARLERRGVKVYAHRAGRRVMAHAEGTAGIKAAVRAGVDSIEHGTVLDDEGAELMASKGPWLVPTLFRFQCGPGVAASLGADAVSVEKMKAILPMQQAAFEAALKHNVRIAYGLDDDLDYVLKEFGALVRGGLSPLGALQAVTINGAELLGWTREAGTIETGKFADSAAVDGDPLTDIGIMERVVFVMKGGEVVKDDRGRAR